MSVEASGCDLQFPASDCNMNCDLEHYSPDPDAYYQHCRNYQTKKQCCIPFHQKYSLLQAFDHKALHISDRYNVMRILQSLWSNASNGW